MTLPKVLVIVGPTASGKTSLSIELAKKFNGEVISADSRQVYRGLDLGTGKVTPEEMRGVPHHMLDVADPKTIYTVSDYVEGAQVALEGILTLNHLPIIVGGSFFYIDALLGRVSLPEVAPNDELRTELDSLTTDALYTLLEARDPRRASTVDRNNRRRLIRALEINAELGPVPLPYTTPRYDALILGIAINRDILQHNIHTRIIERLERGMVDEVKRLVAEGVSYDRLDALGLEYRYIGQYLEGKLSYDHMVETLETKTRQFTKRQMTWLKRDTEIQWIDPHNLEMITQVATRFLEI